ncbi:MULTISPECIES: hypothetical protein [Pseudanabaena]|uniref:Uncharacterized protein n=2 Tax=Pseudanabaena TaxID=1152 RepID=L8MSR9_9CYAN|nr:MULTISPECIES: hypothetical protein [Pseudanabaena]ELS30962.1 hypothetical protein Pse7429DRAFT_3962 [Pseudanabaena biceps PCC 7429]MDG3496775.1 hypothetical protein [Pseudanabaena catenata USMAC16]
MSINNTEIRLLLNLWDLGEGQGIVNMGKLLRSASKEKDKATAYKNALQSLIERGEITVSKQKRTEKYSLSDAGLQNLVEGLRSPDFQFEGASVGSRLATKALQLVLQNQGQSDESAPKISSYDEFKVVALETYDQLNRDYNFDNLVPIYRIRRAIGERVTRSQFNEWMLELQSNDVLQLQTTGVEDNAPDKLEDSIMTKVSGLRCYAKKIL